MTRVHFHLSSCDHHICVLYSYGSQQHLSFVPTCSCLAALGVEVLDWGSLVGPDPTSDQLTLTSITMRTSQRWLSANVQKTLQSSSSSKNSQDPGATSTLHSPTQPRCVRFADNKHKKLYASPKMLFGFYQPDIVVKVLSGPAPPIKTDHWIHK